MERDFASFLEDLLEETEGRQRRTRISAPPSVPFAFLDDTQESAAAAPSNAVSAAYLDLREELLEEISAPQTDPTLIAQELRLENIRDRRSLDRLRRKFAFDNHPDRVKPQWRERAMARMQVANQMIDEAKLRLKK